MKDKQPIDPKTQPCGTCKWSVDWIMTKHKEPRINPNRYGRCAFPLGELNIPRCIEPPRLHRSVIWPTATGCPCWEPKP